MGVRIERKKKRHIYFSLLYKIFKLPFASKKRKLSFLLNREWMYGRLAHEFSYEYFSSQEHPSRELSSGFLLDFIKKDHIVVDLGCKYGDIASKIAKTAAQVIGIDIDSAAINIAKEKYKLPNLSFHNSDFFTLLPSLESRPTVLILSHVLEHIDDPAIFLSNAVKGFTYVYIEVPDFDSSYLNHYRKELGLTLNYTDDDHVAEFDRKEIIALASQAGLEITQSEFIYGVQKHWCRVIGT